MNRVTNQRRDHPSDRLTFHLIPHTHWDREWYLTRSAFQARLIPVLDEVLEQLERAPEARFVLDGQTILLEDYLAVRPENEARIAALVQRGALEIGPWYVLSDLLIPTAQSLRRNLEEGTRDSARFGRRLDVLYSPDAFGHPAGLPGLAAEFGIRWAVVRRGLGQPGDFYRWESPGGESVLVYHLPPGGYDAAVGLTEAGAQLERIWQPIRRELVEHASTDQIAVFLGADHHAMVGDVASLRAQLEALEPRHEVRVSGLTEFFEAAESAARSPPVIRGELRRSGGHTWVLQGVHSTRTRMKRKHGNAELTLSRIAEPLARLASGQEASDRGGLLTLAWRTLLQCQFHDTLAGTTSDAVQKEQDVRLDAVLTLCREIATDSFRTLVGHDPDRARDRPDQVAPRLILWNPSESSRSGILTAELSFFRNDVLVGPPSGRRARMGKGYQPFALEAPSGEMIPVQVLATRRDQDRLDAMRHYPDQDEVDRVWVAFRAPEVEGRGVRMLTPRLMQQSPPDEALEVHEGFLANRFVSVGVSAAGVLSMEDRRTGERYPDLGVLEDEPDRGDLYTCSRGPGRAVRGGQAVSQSILAPGPLVGAVETRWRMASAGGGEIGARWLVALYSDSPLVRLRLDLDNCARDHRLRARFPVGRSAAVVAGAAFGVERRHPPAPAHRLEVLEQEVATAPAHRFVALANGSRGLAVLAPGFFEYEMTRGGELVVCLLRSIGELSRGDLPERPGHAGWPTATPEGQELGAHTIELAFVAVGKEDLAVPARLEQLYEEGFLPMQSVYLRDFAGGAPNPSARQA